MRLLKVSFAGVKPFKDGNFEVDFYAKDNVVNTREIYTIKKTIYSKNILAFAGINASGKTSSLKLIYLALNLLRGSSEISQYIMSPDLLGEEAKATIYFYHENLVYKLESHISAKTIQTDDIASSDSVKKHIFSEEFLWVKNIRTVTSRKNLFDFEYCIPIQRNEFAHEVVKYMNEGVSIAAALLRDDFPYIGHMIEDLDSSCKVSFRGNTPSSIIRMFDSSIEYLNEDPNTQMFQLKFKNESNNIDVDDSELIHILSSGTIKGNNIMVRAINVLKSGGYLILDEIENHFNKQLVQVILNLFASSDYNPNGATLVFSTHYPEILDYIARKDGIYFLVRDENYKTEVINYSNRISRVENKKSEVFFANIIKGTAPKHSDIHKFQNYIKEFVNE